jgi:hypothetical protein
VRRLTGRTRAAVVLLVFTAACSSKAPVAGPTPSPTPTAVPPTASASLSPTSSLPPSSPSPPASPTATLVYPLPTAPSPGPTAASGQGTYTNALAAEDYVKAQAASTGFPFTFLDPGVTWGTTATLHVIHATPSGSAGYGGDYFYFFVNGSVVGSQYFTGPIASSSATSPTAYSVVYPVFKPGDPACCPSGGQSTVTFTWSGTALVTSGSLTGARQS